MESQPFKIFDIDGLDDQTHSLLVQVYDGDGFIDQSISDFVEFVEYVDQNQSLLASDFDRFKSQSSRLSNFDEFSDRAQEYDLLKNFFKDYGVIIKTENELKFDDDKEKASKYKNDHDELMDSPTPTPMHYGIFPSNIDDSYFERYNTSTSSCNTFHSDSKPVETKVSKSPSTDNNSNIILDDVSLSLTNSAPQHCITSIFRKRNEPRTKYFLRFPKLCQEYFNSGNLDKLKLLFNEFLAEDLTVVTKGNPPLKGRDNFYQAMCSMQKNVPDMCIFFSNSGYLNRKVISLDGNSFGTFVYANSPDESRAAWNTFEYASIDTFDDHHIIQKHKYDMLKCQNKPIKFERRAKWQYVLSPDFTTIEKMSAFNEKVDIFG